MDDKKLKGLKELSLEELDKIDGGYILRRSDKYEGSFKYVLIDDKTGESICFCTNDYFGFHKASELNSKKMITEEEYKEIFGVDY